MTDSSLNLDKIVHSVVGNLLDSVSENQPQVPSSEIETSEDDWSGDEWVYEPVSFANPKEGLSRRDGTQVESEDRKILMTEVEEKDIITKDDVILPCAKIMSLIDKTIVAEALPDSKPMNEGAVICLEDRRIIGTLTEIFGPVQNPMYSVKVRNSFRPSSNMVQSAQSNQLDSGMVLYAIQKNNFLRADIQHFLPKSL